MNEDIYKCYVRAKSDPKIGYVNKMKKLWDKIPPELILFSGKTLRDQVSRVEKNRVVMETEYRIDENQNNSNGVNNNTTEENFDLRPEHCRWHWNTNCWKSFAWGQTSINETMKDNFMQNIISINSMNFNEQNYNNTVNKTPSPIY